MLLERCSPLVFQPVQLARLFPADMAPWLEQAEEHSRQLWGLHQPLPALETLINARLEANRQQAAAMAPAVDDNMLRQQCTALAQQAWQSLVPYLLRARLLDGIVCLEAVDTLVLLLLMRSNADDEAAAFAATPNRVVAQAVALQLQVRLWLLSLSLADILPTQAQPPHTLQIKGWQHVLATLYAARGEVLGALNIWRQLAADGKMALRHEAAGCAAALLKNCSDDSLVLAHLPWLLQVSEQAATAVLAARSLPACLVLPLLAPSTDARWRFIAHLIAVHGCSEPALHTELALELIAAVLQAHDGGQVAGHERSCLQHHLQHSGLYDQAAVLHALQDTGLHEELVALHSRVSAHSKVGGKPAMLEHSK